MLVHDRGRAFKLKGVDRCGISIAQLDCKVGVQRKKIIPKDFADLQKGGTNDLRDSE
jgi:hypothetical protein